MTKEEFKEKFNVGDNIYLITWDDGCFVNVLHIGDESFFSKGIDGTEGQLYFDSNWQHYKEPVKKDLEEFVYCFRVFRDTQNIIYRLEPVVVYKDYYDKADKERLITKKEAIERGLKV